MKLPLFGDRLIHRFNPMDEQSRNSLTAEFTENYEIIVAEAKRKQLSAIEAKTNADIQAEKLTIKEKIFVALDAFWVRYLMAILFPVIISFFVKKQQAKGEGDDLDDLDEYDDDFDGDRKASNKEDIMRLMKRLSREL